MLTPPPAAIDLSPARAGTQATMLVLATTRPRDLDRVNYPEATR